MVLGFHHRNQLHLSRARTASIIPTNGRSHGLAANADRTWSSTAQISVNGDGLMVVGVGELEVDEVEVVVVVVDVVPVP